MKSKVLIPTLGLCLVFANLGFGQQKSWPRFEFDLSGGYGMTQFEGNSKYAREWSFKYIESVTDYAHLSMKAENGFSFRAGISYFFTPMFGLQLGGGSFSSNLPGDGAFNAQFRWRNDPEVYDSSRNWSGSGKLSSIPLYLNLVGKVRTKVVDFCLSVGPTVYFNRLMASSLIGFTDLYYWEEWYRGSHMEVVGLLKYIIPVRIPDTSWTAFGGNAGIGIDLKVLQQVSIGIEGRYFLEPRKSVRWQWIPGTYWQLDGWESTEFTAADLADFQALQTPIKVKPSFFSISVVFKYAFSLR